MKNCSCSKTPCKNDLINCDLSVRSWSVSLCQPWGGINDLCSWGGAVGAVCPVHVALLGLWTALTWGLREVALPQGGLSFHTQHGQDFFESGVFPCKKLTCWGTPMFYLFLLWAGNNAPTSLYCIDTECLNQLWKPQIKPSTPKRMSHH